MNYEQLAFFNQQLAGMLREGIPLEGALRQLCRSMRRGSVRAAFQKLEAALAQGTPLDEALARSHLPELYRQMVRVGVRSDNLPGVLSILANHYQRVAAIWTRLKAVLFYPILVLVLALGLSLFVALSLQPKVAAMLEDMHFEVDLAALQYRVMAPPLVLSVLLYAAIIVVAVPSLRRWIRWHVPPFKDASLAQLASAMGLMLRGGCSLGEAVTLLRGLEEKTAAGQELASWERRLEEGETSFADIVGASPVVPPLFVWLVEHGGEDTAAGFEQAAETYQARADYRTEMLLTGALPVAVLIVAGVVLVQLLVMTGMLTEMMRLMNSIGGM